MRTRTIVTTQRLRLRTWRASDAQAYNAYCNNADVMEHLGGVMTPRQLRLEVRWFINHQKRYGITFWVMERKRDRAFLGFCGLIRVTETNSTVLGKIEIGWRRRGYAYEAAEATLKYGQGRFAEPIVSRVAPANVGSWGLMSKLQMKRMPDLDYVDRRDRAPLIVYGV
jgi:RimJ/RimL family protein N-acetyltransferase